MHTKQNNRCLDTINLFKADNKSSNNIEEIAICFDKRPRNGLDTKTIETINENILENKYLKKLKILEIGSKTHITIKREGIVAYNWRFHPNPFAKPKSKTVIFTTPKLNSEERRYIECFFFEYSVKFNFISARFGNFENEFKKEIM